MYISAKTYSATTGPVERRFDYECAHCGAKVVAAVRTVGVGSSVALYGAGGGPEEAHLSAQTSAWKCAVHALTTVPCPQCRCMPLSLLTRIEAVRSRIDKRRRLRVPVAAGAAAVTALVTIVPALLDLRNSLWGLLAALSLTLFVGSAVVFGFSWPLKVPSIHRPADVWLLWGPPPNEPTWVQAAPATWPGVPIPVASLSHTLSGVAAVVALCVGGLAFGLLGDTFVRVWIVDPTNSADLTVEIDHEVAGHVRASAGSTADVSFVSFIVRRGREHQVTLVEGSGARRAMTLDAARDRKAGWVIALDAAEHDLCLFESEVVYTDQTDQPPPEAKLLTRGAGEVMPVTKSIDYAFVAPPPTIERNGPVTRKRALRAYACSALAEDRLVPFRASVAR